MGSISELHIAVLVNHPPHTTFWLEVKQAFVDSFAVVAPHAKVDFFDSIICGDYPEPQRYDLIILSGGKGNCLASDAWLLRQIEFVRDLVERHPSKKLMGICLGHQLLVRALGGRVRNISSGPIAGLTETNLTEEGSRFFPCLAKRGSYMASQFHVREVERAPSGFVQLAENNEMLISASNTIFSIQAHPEIDGIFSKKILDDDDPTYVQHLTPAEIATIKNHSTDAQDGHAVLRRVVEWLEE